MMNNEQKKETRKLPGFYIALCCCVLVIGIAGYFSERSNKSKDDAMINTADVGNVDTSEVFSETDVAESPEEALNETETSNNSVPDSEIVKNDNSFMTETAPEEADFAAAPVYGDTAEAFDNSALQGDGIIPEYAVDNPDVEDVAVIVSAEDFPLNMPVNGAVLEDFSSELTYNSALADWRTHNGIDIGAEVGGSVCAAADGVIEEITDNSMGDVIVISHSDDLKTKYMCLDGTESLSVGDEVKSGDVIGLIGESQGESVSEAHLHFEVYSGEDPVNPMDYIAH